MFKKVTGNDNLLISLSGTFVTLDGQECTPPSHGNTLVEVEIYGKLEIVCKEWLAMLSHFEVDLSKGSHFDMRPMNRGLQKHFQHRLCRSAFWQLT